MSGALASRIAVLSEFTEVQSGKDDDRPQLAEALRLCRLTNSTLLIAKLDRLSRNVAFLATLQQSGTKFVACDLPEANELVVHILAAVAQAERKAISERTRAALAAAKARGIRLGNPQLKPGMLHYGYVDPRRNRFILCCDDYRFINHSDTPNVRVDLTEDFYGVDLAARDIETGEELTVDYGVVEGVRP